VKVEKRGKFKIYFDVLQLLDNEMKSGDKPSFTRVAHEANLPYDRFRNCLDYFIQVGMVSRKDEKLVVTEKGLEYVEEFKKITDFLRQMGLLP
jgi:predicted transcriptional regulator